jgi:predicted ATPase
VTEALFSTGPVPDCCSNDLHMDYSAVGQTTHLAARMEQLATPGSIRLTAETLRLAEGLVEVTTLGPVPVKGLAEPVEVFELVGASPIRRRLQATVARGLTRFVGRESELEALRQALARAYAGHGQIVALVGEPGVGKSRLVYEFIQSYRTNGWQVLESSSVSYGKVTPYLPVIDLLKAYFKIHNRDDQREIREKVTGKLLALDTTLESSLPVFLALLDLSGENPQWQALDWLQRRQRLLDALKHLLLRESQVQPLLLSFEDLHWIDTETQALLDSLIESLPTARMLILVNYRPEYQHGWGGKTYYSQLRIDRLPSKSAETLLHDLLGDDASLALLKSLLIEHTEGTPFFLEESVRALVETRVLVGKRGSYRLPKALPRIRVPATVQAVLAARIDRLPLEAKRVLQLAAVIGRDVTIPLLKAVAGLPEPALQRSLVHLQAGELLYEKTQMAERTMTFKHALTQETVYHSLLKNTRQQHHQQIAQAMEHAYATNLDAHLSEIAHHLICAGPLVDIGKVIQYTRRAADHAAAAFAWREAAQYYTATLSAVEANGRLSTAQRAELHMLETFRQAQSYDLPVECYWLYPFEDVTILIARSDSQITHLRLTPNHPGPYPARYDDPRLTREEPIVIVSRGAQGQVSIRTVKRLPRR